jgi:hypothetical protein
MAIHPTKGMTEMDDLTTIGELFHLNPEVAKAALVLLDTRVGGRYLPRKAYAAAPPMTDDQAIRLAIALGWDDPETLRQGALLLGSRMSRTDLEMAAL